MTTPGRRRVRRAPRPRLWIVGGALLAALSAATLLLLAALSLALPATVAALVVAIPVGVGVLVRGIVLHRRASATR